MEDCEEGDGKAGDSLVGNREERCSVVLLAACDPQCQELKDKNEN